MKLNNMDFLESKKTGLQITIFPPYAAILRWRGEGKFKEAQGAEYKIPKELILTKAQSKTGCEIFPDENEVFEDSADLEEYIHFIDQARKKEFDEEDVGGSICHDKFSKRI